MWEKTVVKTLFGWEPQWDFEWSWNAMRLQILTRPKWERQLYSSHEAPSCFRLNHFVSLHGHWCNCLDSSQRQKTNIFRKLQLLIKDKRQRYWANEYKVKTQIVVTDYLWLGSWFCSGTQVLKETKYVFPLLDCSRVYIGTFRTPNVTLVHQILDFI